MIRAFSATGTDLGFFAATGMHAPHGLAFDNAGNLYVASYYELTRDAAESPGAEASG